MTIATSITAGWENTLEAVGGREWLVENGHESVRPVSNLTAETHPRTAIGLHADGTLTLAAVDGRSGFSVGVTASELAGLFVDDGATKAIMLDGGGSTTAFIRRPGDVEATLVNRPSDGFERPVDDSPVRHLRHPDRAARPDRRPTGCEPRHRGRGHPVPGPWR